MIKAFYDRDFGRVVFMGEKVYSLPIDKVIVHPELMSVPTVVDGVLRPLREVVLGVPISAESIHEPAPVVVSYAQHSMQDKEFIASSKDGCLILSKLQPPLKFDGKTDGKSMASIKKEYGGIPAQVLSLISSGHLVKLSSQELSAIRHAKDEQLKVKKETSRKSRGSVRRRDDVDVGDDDNVLPGGIRNATEIRL